MRKTAFFLLVLLFQVMHSSGADKITSAYKQIQKGDFEKARSLLDKQLEKDSVSAGAFHIYSLFFSAKENPAYHLDSAYLFVLKAIEYYPQTEEKTTAQWAKENITFEEAEKLKLQIETRAFQQAQQENTVAALQHFVEYYPNAAQQQQGILLRNALAWKEAEAKNTYGGYLSFIKTYPGAQQMEEAKKRRDRFIFEEETRAGRLSDYRRFTQKHPESYYVREAAAKIYERITLRHTIKTYHDFVTKYAKTPAATPAWEWLLAFYEEKHGLKNFIRQYPHYEHIAYIRKLAEVNSLQYIPFYAQELYGYVDERGTTRIRPDYEYIPKEYLCESITGDYIIVNKNGFLGLIDKLGKEIVQPQYDKIDPIATGLFRVTKNAFQGLIHQSGRQILPMEYDRIEVLNPYFLKVRKNRRWGLVSYTGTVVVAPRYVDLASSGDDFVVFREGNQYAVEGNEAIMEMVAEQTRTIEAVYTKVELIEEKYFILEQEERLGVLDRNSRVIVPIQNKQVEFMDGIGWAALRDSTWQTYTLEGKKITPFPLDRVAFGKHYIGGKKEGKWGVFNTKGEVARPFEYDSLFFVGDALFLKKGRKLIAEFTKDSTQKEVEFSAFKNIRLEKGNYPNAQTFIYYENRYGKKGLFSQDGKQILSTKYQTVYVLDNDLINIELYNKYGLVDTQGHVVLPTRYDGITNLQEDTCYKVLLSNRRFGLFSKSKNIRIEPVYDSKPGIFAQTDSTAMFLVRKRGKAGIVNKANKTIIPFKFKEIHHWADSIVLVQGSTEEWLFYNYTQPRPDSFALDTVRFEQVEFIKKHREEVIAKVQKEGLWGVWSSTQGEIVPIEFQAVYNRGTEEKPLFFAQRAGKKRNRYEVVYYNYLGTQLWQAELNDLDYYKILCE